MGHRLELQESSSLLDGAGRPVWLQQQHANTVGSKCRCAVAGLPPWKVTDGGGVLHHHLCGRLTGMEDEAPEVRDAELGDWLSANLTSQQ